LKKIGAFNFRFDYFILCEHCWINPTVEISAGLKAEENKLENTFVSLAKLVSTKLTLPQL